MLFVKQKGSPTPNSGYWWYKYCCVRLVGMRKKEEKTLLSTDCLISTNAQFTQSTLTIEVLLVMKCYLFLQVFLAFWIRVLPSL